MRNSGSFPFLLESFRLRIMPTLQCLAWIVAAVSLRTGTFAMASASNAPAATSFPYNSTTVADNMTMSLNSAFVTSNRSSDIPNPYISSFEDLVVEGLEHMFAEAYSNSVYLLQAQAYKPGGSEALDFRYIQIVCLARARHEQLIRQRNSWVAPSLWLPVERVPFPPLDPASGARPGHSNVDFWDWALVRPTLLFTLEGAIGLLHSAGYEGPWLVFVMVNFEKDPWTEEGDHNRGGTCDEHCIGGENNRTVKRKSSCEVECRRWLLLLSSRSTTG